MLQSGFLRLLDPSKIFPEQCRLCLPKTVVPYGRASFEPYRIAGERDDGCPRVLLESLWRRRWRKVLRLPATTAAFTACTQ
eukprot:scaffold9391_cov39-Cyclotella_meneghiniana.AAC.12